MKTAGARAFVHLLDQAIPCGPLKLLSIPVPRCDPERIFSVASRIAGSEPRFFFSPPTGPALAGFGAAVRLVAHGADRLRSIEQQAATVFASWPSPLLGARAGWRFVGGSAFRPDDMGDAFLGFEEADFSLSRWCYRKQGDSAFLEGAFSAETFEEQGGRGLLLEELAALWSQLHQPEDHPKDEVRSAPIQVDRIFDDDADDWRKSVERVLFEIDASRMEKVVLSRAASYRSAGVPIDPLGVLRRLPTLAATRFAFSREGSTFVGATPERLLTKSHKSVQTEALAGTTPHADAQARRRLDRSQKDQHEHHLVVREIVRRLAPFCSRLDVPSEPSARELTNITHLLTPIRGTLERDQHLLQLASRLHPTPAVCGHPTDQSRRMIAALEPHHRGWYTGLVGWFDGRGDGDFRVALRCGVVRGVCAVAFAGGGIVKGSDPLAELWETELKLQTFADALTERMGRVSPKNGASFFAKASAIAAAKNPGRKAAQS